MKASMTLKPLVFAMAAAMAIAAQANERDHHHHNYDPLLDRNAGNATASIDPDQYIGEGTSVSNEGTQNSVDLTDSLSGNTGNVGANIAAGSVNQQVNRVAIATADENFVFGSAVATIDIAQSNQGTATTVTGSNAITADGLGNDVSGNVGINMASGDLNQQANALAIATARGWEATATANGEQNMSGVTVDNQAAGVTYEKSLVVNNDYSHSHSSQASSDSSDTWQASAQAQSASSRAAAGSLTAHYDSASTANQAYTSSYDASADASQSSSASSSWDKTVNVDATASASLDTHVVVSPERIHAHGDGALNIDATASMTEDASQQSAAAFDASGSVDASSSYTADESNDVNRSFAADYSDSQEASMSASADRSESHTANSAIEEVGSSSLASSVTYTETRTFLDPVTNSVSLTNAFNGASGNMGVNVSAGTSNQQLNTMAIAVGCNSCNQ